MAHIVLHGGGKLDEFLRDLAKKLDRPGVLSVGFLENATYPDGTKVAMVAALQNFGSPVNNIPPRPFFSNMIREKSDGWGDKMARILKDQNYDVRASLELMGEGIKGQLVQSIHDTNTPPLAPATIARKGFAKPLIDTDNMWHSVDSEVTEP